MDEKLKEILRHKGIERLTPLQRRALSPIMEGKSTLIIAPTGSGKTEAALVPLFLRHLLERRSDERREGFRILYIAPLRALNRDLLDRVEGWCERMGISVGVRHSDTTQSERTRQSKTPPEMLITTPETLQILFTGRRLRRHLKGVKSVVIDEIHELYGEDRGAQLAVGLERLEEVAGPVQRIGLSATVEDPKSVAKFLVGVRDEPVIIKSDLKKVMDITIYPAVEKGDLVKRALSYRMSPRSMDALDHIKEDSEKYRKILIFTNTRDGAEAYGSWFHQVFPDFPVEVHHGSLSREIRTDVERRFKKGDLKALICTSSMELGIDIGDVDKVYQITSPRRVERLVQRIGRSGHSITGVSRGEIITFSFDDILESVIISRKSGSGELEKRRLREKPMTVLVNQILAMLLSERKITMSRLYGLFKKTWPFRKLRFKELQDVVNFLSSLHILKYNESEGVLYSVRRTRTYFYSNISMIPDERSYDLKDLSSGRVVGRLDEKFVASFIAPGARFILYGRVWEVISVDDNSIVISPVAGFGEIPNWVGEDIPVDYEVAQSVGELRGFLEEVARGVKGLRELSDSYAVDESVLNEALKLVKKQVDEGYTVPTDRVITVEEGEDEIVVNACVGTEVAEAVSKLVGWELSRGGMGGIAVEVDPYRIVIRSRYRIKGRDVAQILKGLAFTHIRERLSLSLRDSMIFRWQILHVAKKFGIVDREATLKDINMNRLIDRLEGTPVYREAIERILQERMDLKNTVEFLKNVARGRVKIIVQRISPIGGAYRDARRELLYAATDENMILSIVERRLLDTPLKMVCLNCLTTWRATAGGEAPLVCPSCSSRRVSALHPLDYERMEKRLKRREFAALSPTDRKKLSLSADLIMSYGRDALLVLAGRGVGPTEAARILSFPYEDRLELVNAVRKAEIKYARNRQFWA